MPLLGLFFLCWLASLIAGVVIHWVAGVLVCRVRRTPRRYSDASALWGAVSGSLAASILAGIIAFRTGTHSSGMVDWLVDPMIGAMAGGFAGAVAGAWIGDAWGRSDEHSRE